jgi:hypothetical protein
MYSTFPGPGTATTSYRGTMNAKDTPQKRSSFVPNSFQTPNAYVDEFLSYLSGEEYKVLSYATRRILGFQKRQDHISLSQFTDGTKSKTGEVLDKGTGLSLETVKTCLASLVAFGLMIKIADNDPHTNEGTLWGLQWDAEEVNYQALENRDAARRKAAAQKMIKVRAGRQPPPSIPHTPPYGIEGGGPNGIEGGGAYGIEGGGAYGIETQYTDEIQIEIQKKKKMISIWKNVLEQFKAEMKKHTFETYLKDTEPLDLDEDVLRIAVPTLYNRDWLEARVLSRAKQLVIGVANQPLDIEFLYRKPDGA